MTEQFRFKQIVRDRRAVDRDKGLLLASTFIVQVAGQHFFAGAAFAGDQHAGVRGGDLIGQFEGGGHHRVGVNDGALVLAYGGQNGGDQFGVRRQGDVLLGAGADGGLGGLGVGVDAAGDHRCVDALGFHRLQQAWRRQPHVDHHQIGAASIAQSGQAGFDGFHMADLGAAANGDLPGRADMAGQGSDNQQAHNLLSLGKSVSSFRV